MARVPFVDEPAAAAKSGLRSERINGPSAADALEAFFRAAWDSICVGRCPAICTGVAGCREELEAASLTSNDMPHGKSGEGWVTALTSWC